MANLKQGMSGSEVKDLQEKLISAGYDVGSTKADGVFGQNTLKAVQDFQRDNNLTVDGIAGKNTLGALNNLSSNKSNTGGNNGAQVAGSNAGTAGNNAAPAAAPPTTTETSTFTHPSYADVKSDTVIQAENILKEYEATRPGEWVDPYRDKYMGYLEQYENRDPFSYDFNSDALYQQYKDQYVLQGQMAMMDTMGQAAAMTGGYGNSYAQTVGQQAYNQQLGQLNEIMPELYGMAYDRYNQEGQDMLNMYNAYLGLSERDEASHQNMLDNWYQEMARLTDNANTLYQRDYNDYSTGRSEAFSNYQTGVNQTFTANENQKDRDLTQEESNKKWDYQYEQDAKAEKEANYSKLYSLISSIGYVPSPEELTAAGMSQKEANALKSAYDSGISVGSKTGTETKYADFDVEEQDKWTKKFAAAKSPAEVETLAKQMVQAKINPATAKAWKEDYLGRLEENGYEGNIGTKRKSEIEDWLISTLTNKNLSSSFDPNRLIQGSGFLTSDAEREYARAILAELK